jgi:hypothetical protein
MSRRRKNPTMDDLTTWVVWGAIGVGLYLLYKAFTATASAVSSAASTASSTVADLIPTNIAAPGGSFTVTQNDGSTVTVPYGWKQGDPIPVDTSTMADFSNAGNF